MNPFEYLFSKPFTRAVERATGQPVDLRCATCRELGYACGDACFDVRFDAAWKRGIANARRRRREDRAIRWHHRLARWRRALARLWHWLTSGVDWRDR